MRKKRMDKRAAYRAKVDARKREERKLAAEKKKKEEEL